MKLKIQPPGSELCGPYCVAMIVGDNPKEVIKEFRHPYATNYVELIFVLRQYGYECPDNKMEPFNSKTIIPKRCIMNIRWKDAKMGHWVVCYQGVVYDPVGIKCNLEDYIKVIKSKGRIASLLRIKKSTI